MYFFTDYFDRLVYEGKNVFNHLIHNVNNMKRKGKKKSWILKN